MKERLNYAKVEPEALKAMLKLEEYVDKSGLDRTLYELVKVRASQINKCAYCLDMHTKDARRAGESEQRLYALSAWRETPFFTPRERAALDWAEAHTLIAGRGIDDALFDATHAHFSEQGLVDLTLAICAINAWNRMAIGFPAEAGSYRPD